MDILKVEKFLQSKVDPDFRMIDNREREIPFTLMSKPISEAKIALISSAGLYSKGGLPFDTEDLFGDTSFRIISKDVTMEDLDIAHTHYDHKYIREDINTVFPVELLKELEKQGEIGELVNQNYSFSGYILKTEELKKDLSIKVLNLLQEDQVDAVILAPV
ncbi:glycine/sarcosine/betaine reductase selenoprotein B family protein [Haloplasma contractile]|uniref:Glycine/sarcosine/betaine reductase selenoprotein n=1 Tax=Haloplasma contractile SSD-17B TaxID=1033810 RepID=U2E710_9MOLU|nr:glycine/sarcosine/betaine reductase selenoprotein B family protein [Haloplasma contractile]ERJ10998.1 Glycine/sarcosine/betaine reductase selenoprotein [Haloplasma contractile SSD-17B]